MTMLPGNWEEPPFKEGKTWQGPLEEHQARGIFDDISIEDFEAVKLHLWELIKSDQSVNIQDPKLVREIMRTMEVNGSTVAMAVFDVSDQREFQAMR